MSREGREEAGVCPRSGSGGPVAGGLGWRPWATRGATPLWRGGHFGNNGAGPSTPQCGEQGREDPRDGKTPGSLWCVL